MGVSAGGAHTVLLRNDGQAVACGRNRHGRCGIPSLRTWAETLLFSPAARRYVPDEPLAESTGVVRVLQLSFAKSGEKIDITCASLAGAALRTVQLHKDCAVMSAQGRIAA